MTSNAIPPFLVDLSCRPDRHVHRYRHKIRIMRQWLRSRPVITRYVTRNERLIRLSLRLRAVFPLRFRYRGISTAPSRGNDSFPSYVRRLVYLFPFESILNSLSRITIFTQQHIGWIVSTKLCIRCVITRIKFRSLSSVYKIQAFKSQVRSRYRYLSKIVPGELGSFDSVSR